MSCGTEASCGGNVSVDVGSEINLPHQVQELLVVARHASYLIRWRIEGVTSDQH
jgi:hypothetical protein